MYSGLLLVLTASFASSSAYSCAASNYGATDTGGDGCDWYDGNTAQCGMHDNEAFSAWTMCCSCIQRACDEGEADQCLMLDGAAKEDNSRMLAEGESEEEICPILFWYAKKGLKDNVEAALKIIGVVFIISCILCCCLGPFVCFGYGLVKARNRKTEVEKGVYIARHRAEQKVSTLARGEQPTMTARDMEPDEIDQAKLNQSLVHKPPSNNSTRTRCCCLSIAIFIIIGVVAFLALVFGSDGEQHSIATSSTTSFGNGHYAPDHDWPTCEDINEFPEENIKLWKVHHQGGGNSLGSLMFEFTNGVMSPALGVQRTANQGFDVMEFDLTKTIGRVEMQIEQPGDRGDLNHIKFFSTEDELMGEKRWHTAGGWWQTIHIPEGKEIIGFYCNTWRVPDYMQSLGFNLWTPPY